MFTLEEREKLSIIITNRRKPWPEEEDDEDNDPTERKVDVYHEIHEPQLTFQFMGALYLKRSDGFRGFVGKTSRLRPLSPSIGAYNGNDGEVVDCVDVHKQPAFDHPLLKNHKIQMVPGTYPKGIQPSDSLAPLFLESWRKMANVLMAQFLSEDELKLVFLSQKGCSILAWQHLNPDQHIRNILPELVITRLIFSYIELVLRSHCAGFVQSNKQMTIGAPLNVSTYNGKQVEVKILIDKDNSSGNWWLYVNDQTVGYWPPSIFTALTNGADNVQWGGEIYENSGSGRQQTNTQMGSVHFPSKGYRNASYVRGFRYKNATGYKVAQPSPVYQLTTVNSCWTLQVSANATDYMMFYGGPGCS
ncbi:neprosin-like protein [Drosera capensis]